MLEHTLPVKIHCRLCCVYGESVVVSLCTVEQCTRQSDRQSKTNDAVYVLYSRKTVTTLSPVCKYR